jgi:8-oxo-dGTP pyrophosphatase MutT (NUDIX family)
MEEDELPDEAALREVREETGIEAELVEEKRYDITDPVQQHQPAGVQLENIGPDHQHTDLIYFADGKVGRYGPEDWDGIRVNAEVRGWCKRALAALDAA